MDIITIIAIVAVIGVAFIPCVALLPEMKITGLPDREDFKHPSPKESFEVFTKDIMRAKSRIDIVTGEVDCAVYDRKDTAPDKNSIFECLHQKLKKRVEIHIYCTPIITISDSIKNIAWLLPTDVRAVQGKVYDEDYINHNEMIRVSGLLYLVLKGYEHEDGTFTKVKLHALKDESYRHFRLIDSGGDNAKLYVEYHHPPLKAVKQFYTVEKSILKIKKYMAKLENLQDKSCLCDTEKIINKKFRIIYRRKYFDIISSDNNYYGS